MTRHAIIVRHTRRLALAECRCGWAHGVPLASPVARQSLRAAMRDHAREARDHG